ncbi:MAG: penicillin acylase family protein [Actinobacteria bacterium]|nr:penicillin acylase family protein [Actinomycetota bacterium]
MRRLVLFAVVVWGLGASVADAREVRVVRAPRGVNATIQTTAHGIPHILAHGYRSLGFGLGWAEGHDGVCVTADAYVTADGERSRFFGPDSSYDQSYENGTAPNNLQSDFLHAKIIKQRVVERLVAQPPPVGPKPEVKQVVYGFAAGYDAALADQHAPAGIRDPACRGQSWVRPIRPIEVWRRIYHLALLASQGVDIDGITAAAPPTGPIFESAIGRARQALAMPHVTNERFRDVLGGLGSNAIALGSAATADGHGIVLANPHFPWYGPERFYQAQLTFPGRMNVGGVGFWGVPAILNGFTRGLAWSHTVSTARRFVVYEVPLVPGDPTSYTVDGTQHKMTRTDVTVAVRNPDGTLGTQSHTFYDTVYGPVTTSISGLPVFPWTLRSAYSMFDANAQNLGRLANHFFDLDRAQSVPQLDRIERRYQGIPWVNTLAADKAGRAYYADIGSMPNIDSDRYDRCLTAVGRVTDQQARLPVLDGSTSSCAPGTAKGAAAAGLLPPSRQPSLVRSDYTENSNDSYWLVNARHLLTGYSRLIGDEGTPRLFRTRFGIKSVEDRLAGRAGPRRRFTPRMVMDLVFNDANYEAQLWLADAKQMCRTHPIMLGSHGPVDVTAACAALDKYDLHENLDSRAALLWRRFSEHVWLDSDSGNPWADSIDPSDPVNTPRKLNTNDRKVQSSFADAVSDLRGAGIPFDARVRDYAYVVRDGERIPIHGGPGVGEFNVMTEPFDPQRGYPDVKHGSSNVFVARLTGRCPDVHTIQTYSQSPDPTSPYYADQTRMYSAKRWIRFRFCKRDILADPALTITRLEAGSSSHSRGRGD